MLSLVTKATLAFLLAVPTLGQVAKPPSRFASEIPKAEAVALAGIVEDDPNNLPAARKGDDESPAYTLYSVPLPIPPVAQVKQ
jgi:bilirubin oxidase